MTRDASVPTPIGNGVAKRRGLPNPRVDAIMQPAQGGSIMEKQPNSRMCFVCGIDNPIGLHLSFYTDEEGRCIARFRPKPEHQGYPGHLHGGLISTLLDVPTQVSMHSDPLSV
jgi:acyl-coenzyme A thioesterase PaaI-like protein